MAAIMRKERINKALGELLIQVRLSIISHTCLVVIESYIGARWRWEGEDRRRERRGGVTNPLLIENCNMYMHNYI